MLGEGVGVDRVLEDVGVALAGTHPAMVMLSPMASVTESTARMCVGKESADRVGIPAEVCFTATD